MSEEKTPLHWIQLELIPLANFEDRFDTMMAWWNPDEGLLEGADEVIWQMIEQAKQAGHIESQLGSTIEITEPLKKTTELAAILAQFFWVVPKPVKEPFEKVEENESDKQEPISLQ